MITVSFITAVHNSGDPRGRPAPQSLTEFVCVCEEAGCVAAAAEALNPVFKGIDRECGQTGIGAACAAHADRLTHVLKVLTPACSCSWCAGLGLSCDCTCMMRMRAGGGLHLLPAQLSTLAGRPLGAAPNAIAATSP
jgi:hypothetical protein